MVKAKIVYHDKSQTIMTFNKSNEYLMEFYLKGYTTSSVESVTIQRYPKKDNPPVDWLALTEIKGKRDGDQ